MSGKVKITQEQADEMNWYRVGAGYTNKYDAYMDFQSDLIRRRIFVDRFNKAMDNGETDVEQYNMMHAYMTGDYEVEPEFKVGDWVVHRHGDIAKVTGINRSHLEVEHRTGSVVDWMISEVKHATPEEIAKEKERRWWAKHGRDVWELKDRDLLIDITTGEICTVWVEHNDLHLTTRGVCLLSVYDSKKLKGGYEVLCFAHDRKDMQA